MRGGQGPRVRPRADLMTGRLVSELVCPFKTPEKLIYQRRLFPQTLLFSGLHNGAAFDPPQHMPVPLEQLRQLRSEIRSLLLGHPLRVYARSTQVTPAGERGLWEDLPPNRAIGQQSAHSEVRPVRDRI